MGLCVCACACVCVRACANGVQVRLYVCVRVDELQTHIETHTTRTQTHTWVVHTLRRPARPACCSLVVSLPERNTGAHMFVLLCTWSNATCTLHYGLQWITSLALRRHKELHPLAASILQLDRRASSRQRQPHLQASEHFRAERCAWPCSSGRWRYGRWPRPSRMQR